jgi:hypothetical protein
MNRAGIGVFRAAACLRSGQRIGTATTALERHFSTATQARQSGDQDCRANQ